MSSIIKAQVQPNDWLDTDYYPIKQIREYSVKQSITGKIIVHRVRGRDNDMPATKIKITLDDFLALFQIDEVNRPQY